MYEVIPKTKNAQSQLRSLSQSTDAYDFWSMPKQKGQKSVVMVPPKFQKRFEKSLRKFNISYMIVVKDIAPYVRAERVHQTNSAKTFSQNIKFKRYLRYDMMIRYMDDLVKKYPQLVDVITIGQSYEKRNIRTIRISNKNATGPKNTILIDAGMHGREWIGPAISIYIVHQLVTNLENRNMLENLDWVILPVLIIYIYIL